MRALETFYHVLSNDPDRACYGYQSVLAADNMQAVDTLLVTDRLFKASDYTERRVYVDLVESVQKNRGVVFIFSSLHVSGQQLDKFTGVAATLRFPCGDVDAITQQENSESQKGHGHGSSALMYRGVLYSSSDSDSEEDAHIFSRAAASTPMDKLGESLSKTGF